MMEMKNEVNLTWVKRGVVHCLGEKGVGEGVESFMYVQTDRDATTSGRRGVSLKTLGFEPGPSANIQPQGRLPWTVLADTPIEVHAEDMQ